MLKVKDTLRSTVNLTFDGERHIHAYARGDVDEERIAANAAERGCARRGALARCWR